jgi:XrtN system VIT domain protein
MICTPDNQLESVTAENAAALFDRCHQRAFSMFPFYLVERPAESLVITGNSGAAVYPGELEGLSIFSRLSKDYFKQGNTVRVFSMGAALSPYIRALVDYQVVICNQGESAVLRDLLEKHQFISPPESDNQVVIDSAGIMINRIPVEPAVAGGGGIGDTTMERLFAYRHIMRKTGRSMLSNDDPGATAALLQEAQQAHIVTPLSSLIVLESQDDYERFNIKDSKDGLQHATLHTKGAVPEPGEWALIILVVMVLGGTMIWSRMGKIGYR